MDDTEARRRAEIFERLHEGPELLVLPNPWDRGTARMFENLGFEGLASTSAGLAFGLGRRDGDGAVSADETFAHIEQLLAVVRIPMSADLENGFGDSPERVAETIRRAGAVGLSGASIEDATYREDAPLYERSLAGALSAAKEILEDGSFEYTNGVPSVAQINDLIAPRDESGATRA